jgi:hypothetical protein
MAVPIRTVFFFLVLCLSAGACHCEDECRSAAECASGVCRDGRCLLPMEPDASSSDGG